MSLFVQPTRSRRLLAATLTGLFLTLAACSPSSEDPDDGMSDTTDVASMAAPDSVNTLTEAEQDAGWQLLFEGTSLDGWRGFARDSVPAGWVVENGAMHLTGDTSAAEGEPPMTLITDEMYQNFELRIEWKISPEGNSGILYRVTEEEDLPYETGPEYQVLDNAALGEDGEAVHQAGALYGLYAPPEDVTRPVGEYNETRILVRGSHVEHWLNGTKLVEAEIGSEAWKKRVKGTKFANWPNFAQATEGHIALQDHGHPVWFRDVKIRTLESDT